MSESKKTKTVEIYVERGRGNEDPNLFVSVNGVNYLIPRGKKSMVPDFVAAEINRAKRASDAMFERRDHMIEQGQDHIVQR